MHPIFLNLERIPVLLVGHDELILKAVKQICRNSIHCKIKIFDENISEEIIQFSSDKSNIILYHRKMEEDDFQNFALLIISTEDHEYEEHLLQLSQNKNILINVIEKPQISDFSLVSVIKKENIKLGISSNDYSPEVQERINRIIEHSIPSDLEEFIEKLKFAYKNPLMNRDDELKSLDTITADYLDQKQKRPLANSEFENLEKITKAVRRRSNIYLGIIGVMVLIGVLSYILFEFQLFPDINAFLNADNHIFYKMLAVGFVAELVVGSTGMGYGIICTTILLMLNIAPPIISASIHSAETFTSAAGSISHFRLKNVNMKLVKALAIPAIIGAIIGALSLTYFGQHYAPIVKPIISCYTLYLGINILRNAFKNNRKEKRIQKSGRNIKILGLFGGFIDSFTGGGWGPMVTGTLLKDGRTPRYVIGSSTLSKFILTITSAITFVITIGIQHWNIVLGLLIGGIVTAPFAAMLTSRIPIKKMFVVIGILIITLSVISIVKSLS
ncbi:ABC transporter permease [Kaistella flava (ex Peng et al. 2021)]|uniref:Probable membrane transporter protein n=2 Tax=Kaistella flava (ex Peng et al. 2021) TaxID=2038776 RepID=A0A7M2YCU2_9FLAO|nr:ABC transporter permease [Kaistella flava (ex Peng et al. 2021)]